jgi:membrane-associated protease RseP (regulator of RpoE activity)
MEQLKNRKFLSLIIGLLGISIVIIIHEFGHFLMCQLFGVRTPIFSLGFGPALFQIPFSSTTFQLSLLPLGGYVSINQADLEAQPYLHIVIIMIAGIVFNIISALLAFAYLHVSQKAETEESLSRTKEIRHFLAQYQGLIGPIGILQLIGSSLLFGSRFFIFILAVLSLNIAFFNLLPVPFFDGGQIMIITFTRLFGVEHANTASLIFWIVILVGILLVMYSQKRKQKIE